MAKSTSKISRMSDDDFAAFQAESAIIWEEARRPDFDWSTVPIPTIWTTTHTVAWCRCHGHPDLKDSRTQIIKSVLAELDRLLVEAGFTRDGKLVWRKGAGGGGGLISGKTVVETQVPVNQVPVQQAEQPVKPGYGIFAGLKRMFKPAKAMIASLPNPMILPVNLPVNLMASSVFLEVQRDRAGACFYINAGIKPGGLHFARSNTLAAEAIGSIYQGYYVFRSVHFTPDLPNTLKPDQFHYMRLKEDPRFLAFMLDLVENRMLACLSAWSDPTKLRPPMPSEMAKNSPLKV